MLERRLWSHFILILSLITCLSIWRMHTSIPILMNSDYANYTSTMNCIFHNINSSYSYPMETLQPYDYTKLMNLSNFKFRILNVCETPPLLLILVHSATSNYAQRKCIRETWGNSLKNVSVFFMLGLAKDSKIEKRIEQENMKHKDIVQGSFLDVYRNITYKHAMSLKYAIYHCSKAKYILKTDDDVFVNMPTMMNFLTLELSPYGAEKLLSCCKRDISPVERSYRSKWRVSFAEYKNRYYPPFCPGFVILYSPDVIFKLYKQVQMCKYFWIDDVLFTGILREKENIEIHDAMPMVLSVDKLNKILKHSLYNGTMFLYGPVNLSIKEMYALNHLLKKGTNYKSVSIR